MSCKQGVYSCRETQICIGATLPCIVYVHVDRSIYMYMYIHVHVYINKNMAIKANLQQVIKQYHIIIVGNISFM